jgi:hypothetical protein
MMMMPAPMVKGIGVAHVKVMSSTVHHYVLLVVKVIDTVRSEESFRGGGGGGCSYTDDVNATKGTSPAQTLREKGKQRWKVVKVIVVAVVVVIVRKKSSRIHD